jgi:hypothetical protein
MGGDDRDGACRWKVRFGGVCALLHREVVIMPVRPALLRGSSGRTARRDTGLRPVLEMLENRRSRQLDEARTGRRPVSRLSVATEQVRPLNYRSTAEPIETPGRRLEAAATVGASTTLAAGAAAAAFGNHSGPFDTARLLSGVLRVAFVVSGTGAVCCSANAMFASGGRRGLLALLLSAAAFACSEWLADAYPGSSFG